MSNNINTHNNIGIAERFINEELGIHWQVDETKESFGRLMYHLEVRTNMKRYFEEALEHLNLGNRKEVVVADIGAGNCWTSALIARYPNVRLVYAVDPSVNRLKHASFVLRHFKVEDKVKLVYGTFLEPNIPEEVDCVVMCASLHHCYNNQMEGLFLNIKKILRPEGTILIANEHYIDWLWILRHLLGYVKHFPERSKLYYYPLKNIRKPEPFSGEHERTKRELINIFKENDFPPKFYVHNGNISKDKSSFLNRMGRHYYNAVLRLK